MQASTNALPYERLADCFNQDAYQSNLGTANTVRQMTEHQTSTNESNTQRGEGQPCRSPAPSRIQQHDECGNRAEADAAERYTDPRNPDSTSYLCESSWALLPWIRDRARERKRQQPSQRDQLCGERDREEAIFGIQRGSLSLSTVVRSLAWLQVGVHAAIYEGQFVRDQIWSAATAK